MPSDINKQAEVTSMTHKNLQIHKKKINSAAFY